MRRKDREVSDEAWMLALIEEAECAHVGLVDGAEPYIVAMNHGLLRSGGALRLAFHCAREGRKLDIIARNPAACAFFHAGGRLIGGDAACEWGYAYRSVLAIGTMRRARSEAERIEALDAIMARHGYQGKPAYDPAVLAATEVLILEIKGMTAKEKPPRIRP